MTHPENDDKTPTVIFVPKFKKKRTESEEEDRILFIGFILFFAWIALIFALGSLSLMFPTKGALIVFIAAVCHIIVAVSYAIWVICGD